MVMEGRMMKNEMIHIKTSQIMSQQWTASFVRVVLPNAGNLNNENKTSINKKVIHHLLQYCPQVRNII